MQTHKVNGMHQLKTRPFSFSVTMDEDGKPVTREVRSDAASPAQKVAGGVFEVTSVEKVNTRHYNQGAAVFTETGQTVAITYPNKVLKSDEDLRKLRFVELEGLRYQIEAGGTMLGQDKLPTDAGSQAKITGAMNKAGRSPSHVFDFKVGRGDFKQFTKAQVEAIFDAVSDHVQACYGAEMAHTIALNAATGQAIIDYDITTGWPST